MGSKLESFSESTVKTVLLLALILMSIGALVFFYLRSNATSGTVEDRPQQMKASVRGRGSTGPGVAR